jgi:hypothetical protein
MDDIKVEYFAIGNHIYTRTTSEGMYDDMLIGTRDEFSKGELHILGID